MRWSCRRLPALRDAYSANFRLRSPRLNSFGGGEILIGVKRPVNGAVSAWSSTYDATSLAGSRFCLGAMLWPVRTNGRAVDSIRRVLTDSFARS